MLYKPSDEVNAVEMPEALISQLKGLIGSVIVKSGARSQ